MITSKRVFTSVLLIGLVTTFSSFLLKGQSCTIDMMFGSCTSTLKFKWDGALSVHGKNINQEGNNYAIGISSRIYKQFFLRTEIGTNSIVQFIDFTYEDKSQYHNGIYDWFGWYSNERIYLSILPEFRFLDNGIFYINAGISILKDLENKFNNGYQHSHTSRKSTDFPQGTIVKNNLTGYHMNIGFNPRFKNVGIVINLGYQYMPPAEVIPFSPKFQISQFSGKFGISYVIR